MMHQPTVLERMRMSVKEKKKPKLAEFSFIVQPFIPAEKIEHHLIPSLGAYNNQDTSELRQYYEEVREERELTFNHFLSIKDKKQIDVEIEKKALVIDVADGKTIEPTIVNGYDGFGGVHDNLLWNANQGSIIYTLNNKVIKEDTKTRKQTIFAESTVRLSCIAQTTDGKLCAAAEGETNAEGNALIYLFETETGKLMNRLTFHQKGVQSLIFANRGQNLISLAVAEENTLVVWDIY